MNEDVRGQAMRKHELVRERILELIGAGIESHGRIPTERDLSADFGFSRLTVRRAIDQLVTEGVLYRVQGSGTYVAEPMIRKGVDLTSFTEDMRSRGLTPSAKLLTVEEVPAGAREGWRLTVSPGEPLHHIVRLRLANSRPMCLEEIWLTARLTPGLMELPLDGSLYDLLSSKYHIEPERADQDVRVTVLDQSQAAYLEMPPFSPALIVERVTWDVKGRPYEYGVSRYRGDRYSLDFSLRRRRHQGGGHET